MSDLKRGTFASVMEGFEDDLEEAVIEPEAAPEEETPEPADEVQEETEDEEAGEEEAEAEAEADGVLEDEETEEESEEAETEDDSTEDDGDMEEAEEEDPLIFTVKIDGKEKEVDEEELLRGYQTAKASTKRFSEAKKMHNEAQAFFQKVTEGKMGDALVAHMTKQNGGDRVKARREVVEQVLAFIAPEIQEMQIEDEREKELYRKQRDIEEQQKELEERQNEARTRQEREAQEEFISDVNVALNEQAQKLKLPTDEKSRTAIWEKAGKMLDTAMLSGSTNDEVLALVPTVMKQIKEERKETAKMLAKTLTAEELEEMYPEQLEALKKKRVARLKKKKSGTKKKASEDEKLESKPKKKRRKGKPKVVNSLDVFNSINLDDFE